MTVFLHHKTPLEDEDIDHGPLNITVPDWLAQDKGMI